MIATAAVSPGCGDEGGDPPDWLSFILNSWAVAPAAAEQR